ncbi:hypothetical protein [Alphaproteobacteria bacterium endosymbiont of Tiliacea citrago]|uniref:hypothetical protein n=1 Tax=Alphaproteobacteria bacterium endosymbiont of Tiliacea citrago TaxID=3077944 RepID=UPI00313F0BE4
MKNLKCFVFLLNYNISSSFDFINFSKKIEQDLYLKKNEFHLLNNEYKKLLHEKNYSQPVLSISYENIDFCVTDYVLYKDGGLFFVDFLTYLDSSTCSDEKMEENELSELIVRLGNEFYNRLILNLNSKINSLNSKFCEFKKK